MHTIDAKATIPITTLVSVLNLSPDAIIVFEPVVTDENEISDLSIVTMNDAGERLFHIPRELAAGSMYKALWSVDNKEGFIWMKMLDVLYTERPQHYEWETYNSGESRWFDVGLQLYEGFIAASYRDITERKKNIIANQEQKDFYQEMMSYGLSRKTILKPLLDADHAIYDFEYDFINYGSDIDDEHRHLSRVPMLRKGERFTRMAPSVRSTQFWQSLIKLARDGMPMRMMLRYDQDGYAVSSEVFGMRMPDGRLMLEHVQAGEMDKLAIAAQSRKQSLDTIMQAVPVGISVFDYVRNAAGEVMDLRLQRCNDLAVVYSTVPADQYVPGMLLGAALSVRHKALFQHLIDLAINDRKHEEEIYKPHVRKWIRLRIIPNHDQLICITQDINNMKKLAQLQAEIAEAAEAETA